MAKKPTPSTAQLDAAHAAARNTDSAPADPVPPEAGKGDLPTQKSIDTQSLASAIPVNSNKPLEHGEANAPLTPEGLRAHPPSRLPGASTLSEENFSGKTGTVAAEGFNASSTRSILCASIRAAHG